MYIKQAHAQLDNQAYNQSYYVSHIPESPISLNNLYEWEYSKSWTIHIRYSVATNFVNVIIFSCLWYSLFVLKLDFSFGPRVISFFARFDSMGEDIHTWQHAWQEGELNLYLNYVDCLGKATFVLLNFLVHQASSSSFCSRSDLKVSSILTMLRPPPFRYDGTSI